VVGIGFDRIERSGRLDGSLEPVTPHIFAREGIRDSYAGKKIR